jgi:glycine/D-amino acid oxidase-like deaminating enzyme/bacterioferritin-associated ferredoxin
LPGRSLRLTKQQGTETVTLLLDGVPIDAVPGESVAAAMTAAGHRRLRTDKTGNPRGLLCGMGSCFECRVSINGGPATRACLTPVEPQMTVTTLVGREALVDHANAPDKQRRTIRCDILVVGAGPAGATAAVRLAAAGKNVVVLDERRAAGGQYFKQKIAAVQTGGEDDRQYQDGRVLIDRLAASAATVFLGATAWGAFRDDAGQLEVAATTDEQSLRILPQQLVVASGACESVPPFPGWTLPGVMATGAAQTLFRAYRVAPGQRVLIAGNGPLNLQLACELAKNEVHIVAVAEAAPAALPGRALAALRMVSSSPRLTLTGLGYLRTLRKFGVPVYNGYRICRATGGARVTEGTIAPVTADDVQRLENARSFSVDTVCVGYRQQPSAELLRALGCRTRREPNGIEVVERDRAGETSVAGVYAIGDGAAPLGAQSAIVEGELLADALLGKPPNRRLRRQQATHRLFQRNLWRLFAAPEPARVPDDVMICRCECVTDVTLRALISAGVTDLDALKRRSRAGMGPCQGRYCARSLARLVSEASAVDGSAGASFTAQNPVKPVAIGDVAEEQPEWRGYRTTGVPPRTASAAASDAVDECDVAIIGAGVIGSAVALYLARRGRQVLLLEAGTANGEASGGNAGSLHLQLLPFDFRSDEPESPAAATLPLQRLGIQLWQTLEEELDADFEMRIGGGLMLADSVADLEFLRQKSALEARFGVSTEVISATEVRSLLPGVAAHVAGGAYCGGEGKINPLLATPQLLAAAQRVGAVLRENTVVNNIESAGSGYRLQTDRGIVECRQVVNAAGGWAGQIASMLGAALPLRPAPQQMLVTQAVDTCLPFLLSVTGRHLSMKQAANGNLIIGGGWPTGFDTTRGRCQPGRDSIAGNLWVARRVFPVVGQLELIRSWGAVGVMIDGAPIIGELPDHPGFYNVVGANGYTMAPALGMLVAELITSGETSIDLAPFGVARFAARDA